MSLAAKIRRAPLRAATGAFILNSGLSKLSADEDTSKAQHGMAVGAYPFLGGIDHKLFVRGMGITETALGTALLLPIAPAGLVGAGLVAFSGGLLTMWWRTPGMHQESSPRPTVQGTGMAKDSWLMGIGASLLVDSIADDTGATRAVRRAERRMAKAEHRAATLERKVAGRRAKGKDVRAELVQRGAQLTEDVREAAEHRSKELRKAAEHRSKELRKAAEHRSKEMRKAAEQRAEEAKKALKARSEDAKAKIAEARAGAEAAAAAARHRVERVTG